MATLSALSSCVVGPNYEAPRISLTAFHSTAPDNQETSGVRPKLDSWWTDFHDSLLTQSIQEALAQSLDLAASWDRVEQARAAQAAGADAQAAEADHAAVRISIAAAVADSYLQVDDPPDFLRSISPGMSVEASPIIRQPPAWLKHMFPRSVATAGSVSPAFRNGQFGGRLRCGWVI
jgi:hypothetical protein